MERRRRLLRRAVRQAERYELWDQAIECRAGLALLSRHDLDAALGELEAAHRLASACLPPGAQGLEALLCSLVCVHTAKGQMQSARRYAALLTGADGEPAPLAGTDPTDAEALWQARQRALGDLLAHGFPTSIDHANVYSRYRRQACQLGRQAEADSFLADLRAAHPKAVVPEEPTPCQSPWGLPMPAPDAITRDDTCPRPIAGVVLGLAALTWRRATTDDLCSWPAPEQVEICPGSEAGLGVLGLAPCLLTEVADDFVLEVCVGRGRPEPRGGGAVVFSGAERLRFASGVDHAGQVSLCRCGGVAPCCHTVGYLGEGGTWLRLRRQGRVYAALASTDQRHWFHCGEAEFGLAGPVQVGIFAEPSHELSMPLPYPTRLADFRLWVAADMPSTARDPDAAVARAQSWADVGGPGLRTTEQEVTANAGVPRNGRPARCALYPLPRPTVTHGMVGQSLALRRFLDLLERLAGNASPLLITGETGTGKELAAQAVHTLSPRRHGPFVPVNVATLAPALVESELFGHRRGSFTGASEDRPGIFVAANGGTLFLDEIGELQLPHQAKLLRALDSGDIRSVGATRSRLVDVRCVAATNRDLPQAVAASAFRLDLLYRLGQQLTLPPLRARRDDLPALVAHFLSALSSADPPTVTVEAMAALAAHDWPGNIRELRAVLEAGVALAGKGPLALEHLRLGATGPPARPRRFRIGETPSAAEVAQLLRACDGDVQAVSRSCGVSRNTVYRWLRRWQITPGTWR
jgi:transcriptional regulator with AAA-type ATPase domain